MCMHYVFENIFIYIYNTLKLQNNRQVINIIIKSSLFSHTYICTYHYKCCDCGDPLETPRGL